MKDLTAAATKVAVLWEGKSGMTIRDLLGFLHRMRKKAPEVKITSRLEPPSMQEAERVFRELD